MIDRQSITVAAQTNSEWPSCERYDRLSASQFAPYHYLLNDPRLQASVGHPLHLSRSLCRSRQLLPRLYPVLDPVVRERQAGVVNRHPHRVPPQLNAQALVRRVKSGVFAHGLSRKNHSLRQLPVSQTARRLTHPLKQAVPVIKQLN